MHEVILKPRAIRMQKEAYDWYEQQKKGLGELFIDELEETYLKLKNFPTAYGRQDRNFRRVILRKFPYIIVFRIIKTTIVVYAVFHTRQDSKSTRK